MSASGNQERLFESGVRTFMIVIENEGAAAASFEGPVDDS